MKTWFHPEVVNVMRGRAEASCLLPFEGVLATSLGFGLAGTFGVPALSVTYTGATDRLTLEWSQLLPDGLGLAIVGTEAHLLPFHGGYLVPSIDLLTLTQADDSGRAAIDTTVDGSYPEGLSWFVQGWFLDAGGRAGCSASEGLAVEIIRP